MSKLYLTAQDEKETFKHTNPFECASVLAGKYSELDYETVELDIVEDAEEIKKLSHFGQLPVLATKEGNIWQSGAISRYFADNGKNKTLRGTGSYAAQVDQVIEFINNNVKDILAIKGKKAGKLEVKAAETQFELLNSFFENVLEVNTYLVGDRFSLADLVVFCHYRWHFVHGWEPEERSKIPNITRWFLSVASQKKVKDTLGEHKLKEKKEVKIESKFNMEEWKRFYMNNKPEDSIKYFWDNLDVKCNSVWISTFKYNEDNKGLDLFIVNNKVAGIQQRAQEFHKIAFAVMAVVGEESAPEITMLWVWEDKRVPQSYQDEIDYPLFDWQRCDWKKDRELVNSYLAQTDSINGKKILDVRTFR